MSVRDMVTALGRARAQRVRHTRYRRLSIGAAVVVGAALLLRALRRPHPKTLVIPLSGRLGNQLFQLAAGAAVERRSGGARIAWKENVYSAETDFRATLFKGAHIVSTEAEACGGREPDAWPQLARNCGNLGAVMAAVRGAHCSVLKALFQCHWLAERGRHAVIYALRAQVAPWDEAQRIVGELRSESPGTPLVAVHVRRGDYTKRFNRNLLEPLPEEYYASALRRFPDAHIVVFSDDLEWCQGAAPFRELKDAGRRVTFLRLEDALVALLVMAHADHHVIANSTFSWWAAFLRDSFADARGEPHTVVAPAQWYGPRVHEPTALLPDHWIALNFSGDEAQAAAARAPEEGDATHTIR